ncbi:STIV orfB116 family protein [Saccharopolyspora shandongensis]
MSGSSFAQQVGQQVLVLKLKGRPEEGKILTAEEFTEIGLESKVMTTTR